MNIKLPNFLISKKALFAVVGVVVLGEIIWAGWTLLKPTFLTKPTDSTTSLIDQLTPQKASLSLESITSVKVGEIFTVKIKETVRQKVDGTDIIINYDPRFIAVLEKQSPVKTGLLFDDYPINLLDEKEGKITVSGITSQKGGVLAQGEFGSISFLAQAPGKTRIFLEFANASTTDSNIIEASTSQDILEEVKDLEVNITP